MLSARLVAGARPYDFRALRSARCRLRRRGGVCDARIAQHCHLRAVFGPFSTIAPVLCGRDNVERSLYRQPSPI